MSHPIIAIFFQLRKARSLRIKPSCGRSSIFKSSIVAAAVAIVVGLALHLTPAPALADENLHQFANENRRQFANQHLGKFADINRRRFANKKRRPPEAGSLDCTLIVPHQPLTAAGLATPYQLVATNPSAGSCHETDVDHSAFVQAVIINLDNGQISVYNPLVIDKGTEPAAPTVVPELPTHHVVALWFGFNGNNLKLVMAPPHDDNLGNSRCVQGLGQYAYCNAVEFFAQAHRLIKDNRLTVPSLGTDKNGNVCPSIRSFFVVDQDQSDNLTTSYLFTTDGDVAQDTATNRAILSGRLTNPSDNRLLDVFIDPALGCTPWMVPDLTNPGASIAALPLNELQAGMFQAPPIALVPLGSPQTLNPPFTGTPNLNRVNLYRRGVDQPLAHDPHDASTTTYCQNIRAINPQKIFQAKEAFLAFRSPATDAADTLFTFLAQRYVASYAILGCEDLLKKPVNVELKANDSGVVVDATLIP